MALRQIKCPHCEHDVQVDVTSVTESRNCPDCGEEIVLRLTSSQKRSKRTVLVVPTVDPVEKLGEASHADYGEARPLSGDVHERMMHDPEVRRNVRRLAWGAGIVAAIILVLCLAEYGRWWSVFDRTPRPPKPSPPTTAAPVASILESPAPAPEQPETVVQAPEPPPIVTPPPAADPPAPAPPVMLNEVAARSEEERATDTVRAFLEAKDVDRRLELVRDVSIMEPIIRAYYSSHPDGPIPFSRILPDARISKTANIRKLTVELADGRKRLATVGRVGSGDYRVDWASFVVYSAMDWAEFMEKRPTDPVFMRVLMEPGTNAAGTFADPREYFCVKIIDPLNAASPPIFGYVERRSPRAESLKLILRTFAGSPFPVMLTLKHPAPTEGISGPGDQVLIDKLIGEGWLANGT